MIPYTREVVLGAAWWLRNSTLDLNHLSTYSARRYVGDDMKDTTGCIETSGLCTRLIYNYKFIYFSDVVVCCPWRKGRYATECAVYNLTNSMSRKFAFEASHGWFV